MFENNTVIAFISLFSCFVVFIYWLNYQCVKANKTNWNNFWLNRLDGLNRLFCVNYHRMPDEPISLPDRGSAIIISNHVSGLDPLLLVAAARRPIRFIIAKEEYERFGLTWLFRAVGCIPVDRHGRTDSALREAIRKLNEGEVIALFPYGGIHEDENKLPRFKRGTVVLAKNADTDIYPLKLAGVKGVGRTLMAVPLRSNVRLHQFAPVSCQSVESHDCVKKLDLILRGPVK